MKYHDFTTFEELEQVHAAWKKGVLLGSRTENFHTILLYELDNVYVEATYHTHFNVLLEVNSFTDMERLDPYLEQINISSVLA
ncbi:MAG: hypothetical protein WKF70_00075 [Chitinophagaceae bacterium]